MLLVANALCAIDDVKLYLMDITSSEKNDRTIAMLINGLSINFEKMTSRKTLIQEYEEKFESPPNIPIMTYRVLAPPIIPGTVEVRIDPTRTFGPNTIKTEGVDYVVDYESGQIRLVSSVLWEVGWNSPYAYQGSSIMARPFREFGFPSTAESVKIKYQGGLVKPRSAPPVMPTVSKVAGTFNGLFLYRFAIRTSSGEESVATYPVLSIELSNQFAEFLFPDPGPGKFIVVYRGRNNERELLFSQMAAGGSGNIVITDSVPDSSLAVADGPFSEGPLIVPSDIRLAVAQQVADWFVRGAAVSTVASSGAPDYSRRFDTSQYTDFMKQAIINYTIIRQ